ncbi:MAG: ATP-binding cassette domain-containing protein [Bdellovibrionales bacterium]|nr:ATP-binding cassette domain-containing protein [Bdellovibrionales bacterium]
MSCLLDCKLIRGEFVLEVPKLEIPDRGVLAITGRSGSGKSTLLGVLIGTIRAPHAKWIWGTDDLLCRKLEDRHVGMVFQSSVVFSKCTALLNLNLAQSRLRKSKAELEMSSEEWLEKMGITNRRNVIAENLSGGERQRLALAMALISEPRILILDEPFASLDIENRDEAKRNVKRILDQIQIPAILVSHDESDVRDLAVQVVLMENGKIKS